MKTNTLATGETLTATVPMPVIEAAILCIDRLELRPLCNSIHFHDGHCIATDGRLLLRQSVPDVAGEFSLSYDMAKWILKHKKEFSIVEIAVTEITKGDKYSQELEIKATLGNCVSKTEQITSATRHARNAVEGVLTPLQANKLERAGFACPYIALIGKIGKILGYPSMALYPNGRRGAHIKYVKPFKTSAGKVEYRETEDIQFILMPVVVNFQEETSA